MQRRGRTHGALIQKYRISFSFIKVTQQIWTRRDITKSRRREGREG